MKNNWVQWFIFVIITLFVLPFVSADLLVTCAPTAANIGTTVQCSVTLSQRVSLSISSVTYTIPGSPLYLVQGVSALPSGYNGGYTPQTGIVSFSTVQSGLSPTSLGIINLRAGNSVSGDITGIFAALLSSVEIRDGFGVPVNFGLVRISNSVTVTQCNNGLIEIGEMCDDRNTISGDGCSSACTIESGYTCAGTPSICTPLAAAYNFNLVCPPSIEVGNTLICGVILDTAVAAGTPFGGQFVIIAPDYTAATPLIVGDVFVNAFSAGLGTGALPCSTDRQTILVDSNLLVPPGHTGNTAVATIHLNTAGMTLGSHSVGLNCLSGVGNTANQNVVVDLLAPGTSGAVLCVNNQNMLTTPCTCQQPFEQIGNICTGLLGRIRNILNDDRNGDGIPDGLTRLQKITAIASELRDYLLV